MHAGRRTDPSEQEGKNRQHGMEQPNMGRAEHPESGAAKIQRVMVYAENAARARDTYGSNSRVIRTELKLASGRGCTR